MRTRLPVDPAGCKGDAMPGGSSWYANRNRHHPVASHWRRLWTV